MKQISSMDLFFLIKELKILENQRIDSFYLENNIFYFKIYIKNQGNKFLTFNIGKSIYLGEKKEESSMPSSFISYLRKHLKNTFIRKIEQIENERIIKIEIEKKVDENKFETFNLFLETFQPGNIILTDKDFIIKNMLFRKKFKDRKVIAKEKYELPPKKDISIFELDKKVLLKELKNSDLSIVKFIAIKFGLGGKFSEEIIFRSKIDKDKLTTQLDSKEADKLIKSIDEIKSKEIEAFSISDKTDKVIDFIPFDFKSVESGKQKEDSFNNVIKEYFSTIELGEKKDNHEKEFELNLKKLKNRLKKQESSIEDIYEKSENFNGLGNKIYENYSLIEELLDVINKTAKEKGWGYVEKIVKESTDERLKLIKKLDYKNNLIILEL